MSSSIELVHRHGTPEHLPRGFVVPDLREPEGQDEDVSFIEEFPCRKPDFLIVTVLFRLPAMPQLDLRDPVLPSPFELLQDRVNIHEAIGDPLNIGGTLPLCGDIKTK